MGFHWMAGLFALLIPAPANRALKLVNLMRLRNNQESTGGRHGIGGEAILSGK